MCGRLSLGANYNQSLSGLKYQICGRLSLSANYRFIPRSALPIKWLVLAEFLHQHPPNQPTEANLNLLLEEIVLKDEDNDGESVTDDADISGEAEHVPSEDEEQLETNSGACSL
ncbi:hypothetical protein H4Q26_014184 [Puccinia striiformis f. sp. tritici PST-130]|nr:hypothetical protein H4Q26_014184 [Puccinia striiformis f. sp. tritici PST-130]